MCAAVVDADGHPDDGKTDQRAFLHAALKPLVAGWNVLGRNRPAFHLIDEIVLSVFSRFQRSCHPGELPGSAGLLLVRVVELCSPGDGFPVGNLGHAGLHIGAVLPADPLQVDLQVQLPHAADDGLLGFRVDVGLEGGIFLGEAVQCFGQQILGFLFSGLHRQGDHRLRYVHAGHRVVQAPVGKGVAGGAVDAEQGHDVSACRFADLLHLVGMHAHQAADAESLAAPAVVQLISLAHHSLVDADVGELSVLAVLQLESQGYKGLIRLRPQDDRLLVPVQVQGPVLNLRRRGQVADRPVQQRPHSHVFVGRADEHGGELLGQGSPANGIVDHLFAGLTFQVRLGKLVGKHAGRVDQLLPQALGLLHERMGDIGGDHRFVHRALVVQRFHPHQVHDALELPLQPDRHLHQHRVVAQPFAQLIGHPQRVGSHAVAFVDEGQPGYVVALQLAIHGQCL